MSRPERLAVLLPAVVADLAEQHTTTNGAPPMTSKPTVVTICGSMRFFEQMLTVAADETAQGRVVLAPFSVVAPEDQGGDFKAMLDELHRRKIDMADKVVIVTNQHGYIGASTRGEMVYAAQTGKPWDVREFHLAEPTPNNHGQAGAA